MFVCFVLNPLASGATYVCLYVSCNSRVRMWVVEYSVCLYVCMFFGGSGLFCIHIYPCMFLVDFHILYIHKTYKWLILLKTYKHTFYVRYATALLIIVERPCSVEWAAIPDAAVMRIMCVWSVLAQYKDHICHLILIHPVAFPPSLHPGAGGNIRPREV